MTSMPIRMPFESYTVQHNFSNSSNDFGRNGSATSADSTYVGGSSMNGNKMNNYNDNNHSHHTQFHFQPQITTFSIKSVDEDEIPEEKMHSPRTPYGSVPDPTPINKNQHHQQFGFSDHLNVQYNHHHHSNNNNNNNNNNNKNERQQERQYLYPPNMEPMQRTISASSIDSVVSYSANSTTMEQENVLNINYTPTLSATSSINRSGVYSTSTSPDRTPVVSPKSYKLKINGVDRSNEIEKDEKEEEEEGNQHENKKLKFGFGEQNDRNGRIQELETALRALNGKKQNGWNNYKHGLETYSNGQNSGVNTGGTATPNSIGQLSRSSSCNSLIGDSECSFDDNALDDNDLESDVNVDDVNDVNDNDLQFISSGASTPTTPMVMELDITITGITGLNASKLGECSEDEMETPVPTSAVEDTTSPFDFENAKTKKSPKRLQMFDPNAHPLAQICEDAEHESNITVTPNTPHRTVSLESKESNDSEESPETDDLIHGPHFDIIDDDSSDDEEDEPIPQKIDGQIKYNKVLTDCDDDLVVMDLEDEIILKGSRFQSQRVLFLDVDGVLLNTSEQATLGKKGDIKFNDDVTSLMIKLCRETQCDIVISSTWQFHAVTHLPYLISYLVACGWQRNKIHTLLDLLPSHTNDGIEYGREWYEQSPYCRCRARGIQKIVSLYGAYITRWCCLDDLPLHSQKPVCIPKKEDMKQMIDNVSDAYFKPFTWRVDQKDELMPDIKYCVKYALTSLPNCIFSSQSYRFGYEYNQTMIYYQADAIAKLCKLTYEIKDNVTYQLILQNMIAVINQYIGANLTYQGDPYIAPYLIQTDQQIGITPQNIENTITLLTYNDNTYHNIQQTQQTQMNDPNNTV